jgi:uncharacterized protein (TIGR02301 family)
MIRAAFLFMLLVSSAAMAQTPPERPPAPPQRDIAKPYEAELGRLVETLGALSVIAALCEEKEKGAAKTAEWRSRAAALIDSEAPDGPRRTKLLGFYRRGQDSLAMLHRQCTDATRSLAGRLLADADQLARSIGARFGD